MEYQKSGTYIHVWQLTSTHFENYVYRMFRWITTHASMCLL